MEDVSTSYEPWASSAAARRVMRSNRRRDTAPEMAIRRAVHAAGLRYRVDSRPLPELNRRADLVFRPPMVAVFVDGCYWHMCPTHGSRPRTNSSYWSSKLERNAMRDADTNRRLEEKGWLVLRIWEHEDPLEAAHRITAAVVSRRSSSLPLSLGVEAQQKRQRSSTRETHIG